MKRHEPPNLQERISMNDWKWNHVKVNLLQIPQQPTLIYKDASNN